MALTKVNRGGLNTGVSDSSNATFLTATSAEGVTLAGTLAVTGVHTVGTNAVATSEGGAATTSVVQGLAKCWINFNGTGTIAITDSFNMTSITDNGTGDYTVTIANDMNAGNYAVATAGRQTTDTDERLRIDNIATSSHNVTNLKGDGTKYDTTIICCTHHGDLA